MSSPGIYSSRDSAFASSKKQQENNNATRITFRNAPRVHECSMARFNLSRRASSSYRASRVDIPRWRRRIRDLSTCHDVYPKVYRRIRDQHALLLGRSWGYAARWGWLVTDSLRASRRRRHLCALAFPPSRGELDPLDGTAAASPPRADPLLVQLHNRRRGL